MLRKHLVEVHGEDSKEIDEKDVRTLELYHFMLHDRMRMGWETPYPTEDHIYEA